jgi:hypothetical protein
MRKLTEKEVADSGLAGYARYFERNGKIYGAQAGEKEAHLIKGAALKNALDEKRAQAGENAERGADYYNWLSN